MLPRLEIILIDVLLCTCLNIYFLLNFDMVCPTNKKPGNLLSFCVWVLYVVCFTWLQEEKHDHNIMVHQDYPLCL